jgi:hypothetical protein
MQLADREADRDVVGVGWRNPLIILTTISKEVYSIPVDSAWYVLYFFSLLANKKC